MNPAPARREALPRSLRAARGGNTPSNGRAPVIAMHPDQDNPASAAIPIPRLSDNAVVPRGSATTRSSRSATSSGTSSACSKRATATRSIATTRIGRRTTSSAPSRRSASTTHRSEPATVDPRAPPASTLPVPLALRVMVLMDTIDLDRDVAVRRIAVADHAQRWLRSPSSSSISGPSNWVIALTQARCALA